MGIGAVRTGRPLAAGIALSVVGLVAAAGCGSEKMAEDGGDALAERARQVADAWDGSSAATAWRAGYHPTGEAVRLPRGGLHDGADQQAYERRNFKVRGTLPDAGPKDGTVSWAAGHSVTRPLVGAKEAYDTLAGPRAEGKPQLAVIGVELGRMRMSTSRGPASVPAWVFTLDGYASPLKQAAAVPSKTPRSPVKAAHDLPDPPLNRLLKVSADGRAVTVVALHGVCDDGPTVDALETRGSVVLSASVTGRDPGRICTKQAKLERVEVRLREPLGDRVLLDAHSGKPVPYRWTNGLAP
ncbi:hypothetical protein [Streptomyces endophyticus]|uniref:Lipoprotein n=1 Tax=Streptomyces endophyticus TaxID=714166 RepID=A0ABU6FG37_9ACTN|nr:hypothetical protein [Streptomyces endophyticus]MEB8342433.1 hypothetical protein [Streptomyces endophyticus]